jgi:microcystin-dependent protein
MEAFVGTIMPVGFPFAPRGWALCQGQTLAISQYSALFALIGTTYGGNGQTTFALPDLRGRTLVGQGTGLGLQPVTPGEVLGAANATMTVNGNAMVTIDAANLPKHDHPVTITGDQFTMTSTLKATTTAGTAVPAEGSTLGSGGGGPGAANIYVGGGVTPDVSLNAGSVTTKMAGQVNTNTGQNSGSGNAFPAPFSGSGTVSVTQPSLGINYIICVEGIFPSRN